MINHKEALEIILAWRPDYEEMIYPEIITFIHAVLANDEDAKEYAKLLRMKPDYEYRIDSKEYKFLELFDKKYETKE